MRRLRDVHAVQPDRVAVDAGATWREVIAATLPEGLVPPVLPDYLDLSVGGTLSVGGVGATWRSGVVTDHVLELQVVTGRGERVTCSPTRSRRLFPRDQRFEGLQGAVLPAPAGGWTFRLDAVKASSGTPPAAALLAGLSDVRPKAEPSTLGPPRPPHPVHRPEAAGALQRPVVVPATVAGHLVGHSSVEPLVAGELAELSPADLGPLGQIVVSRSSFGPAFAQVSEARREYDPGHVLTPGYEVFQPPPARRAARR
jgi:cytokinin dehydrogenase